MRPVSPLRKSPFNLASPARYAALAVVALAALLPEPRVAEARRASDPAGAARPPAERALTGGIVSLRSPGALMIRIPATTFRMGSTASEIVETVADCAREPLGKDCDESRFADELPAHPVTLASYYLDQMEVTVEAYRRCVAARRCEPIPFDEGARRFDLPRYPVVLVTWENARRYCEFRGARLPTEAEFERAMRGLSGRRYPWGDLYNSRVSNHGRLGIDWSDARDGYAELAPVGAFPSGRTPDGFLDLAGNVAEWVFDRYVPGYPEGPVTNPFGPRSPPAGSERVVRGGSYRSASPWLRSAARSGEETGERFPYVGFRCARGFVRRANP